MSTWLADPSVNILANIVGILAPVAALIVGGYKFYRSRTQPTRSRRRRAPRKPNWRRPQRRSVSLDLDNNLKKLEVEGAKRLEVEGAGDRSLKKLIIEFDDGPKG